MLSRGSTKHSSLFRCWLRNCETGSLRITFQVLAGDRADYNIPDYRDTPVPAVPQTGTAGPFVSGEDRAGRLPEGDPKGSHANEPGGQPVPPGECTRAGPVISNRGGPRSGGEVLLPVHETVEVTSLHPLFQGYPGPEKPREINSPQNAPFANRSHI